MVAVIWASSAFAEGVTPAQIDAACDTGGKPEFRLDKDGGSLANEPVMNQHLGWRQGGGICYAFVSSQLVDAWRTRNGTQPKGYVSSPYVTAFQNAAKFNRDDYTSGDSCRGVQVAVENGTCDHNAFFAAQGEDPSTVLFNLEEAWKDWEDYLFINSVLLKPDDAAKMLERAKVDSSQFACRITDGGKSVSPKLLETIRLTLLDLYERKDLYDGQGQNDAKKKARFLDDFMKKVCESTRLPVKPAPKCESHDYYGAESKKQIQLDILTNLSSNGLPVGVGFCQGVLFDPKYGVGLSETASTWGNSLPSRSCTGGRPAHIAMVIGKRKKAGKCQVLVRNSFGPECGIYAESGLECDHGQVWIDLDRLGANSFALQYVTQP